MLGLIELSIEIKKVLLPIFGGIYVPVTLLNAFLASFIILVLALVVRIFLIPKFKDEPKGIQLVIEMAVDGVGKYTESKVGSDVSRTLAPYIFTVAVFIFISGLLEYAGMRPNTSDLNSTIALSLITFALIQFYSIKKKGIIGRLKTISGPMPKALFPIKLITDFAVPVSLACRMFGNILGGVVVMELLYSVGFLKFIIPGVLSLYFTLFHTGMQAFVFITLSLTFIEEARE